MLAELTKQDLQLPWDYFLKQEVNSQTYSGLREELLRKHINVFREVEWPNIKRQLGQEFNWVVPDSLEPHWVASGRAILWQEQVRRVRVNKVDGEGHPYRVIEEQSQGWTPLASGVACNNAGTIASYLKNGLRFRPPVKGVDVAMQSAVPSPAPQMIPSAKWECNRHNGHKVFNTWRGYVHHCINFRETVEGQPPQAVLERMTQSKYFCGLHMKGFASAKAAKHHYTTEMRRPGRSLHPSLTDMEVRP